VEGCPVGIDIPGFIGLIRRGKYSQAVKKIKEKNTLPAICGRVCPQEDQCQKKCRESIGDLINIGGLERFVADWEMKNGISLPMIPPSTHKRVAIVGSGPAGLTAAAELARMGHRIVIFEALHKLGGVLTYGIPEFRLPKEVVETEIDYIKKIGVETETNVVIGKTKTVDELLEGEFEAIFIASGAGLPSFLDIPGENLNGIYSANEFLLRVNLMKAYKFPYNSDTPIKVRGRVAVIGGGNVAIDAARCARRLNTEEVQVLYRRTEEEMPARPNEVKHAREEGIKINFLTQPTRFIGDEYGFIKAVECVKMRLGSIDESQRRKPIPIEGSRFHLNVGTVIVAIGQIPHPIITRTTEGIEISKSGTIVVDPETLETSRKMIFAGGDIVSGAATVISAMKAGKTAARSINRLLSED
jgi:glutamate synthase (NADPH/NADH) small chain